MSDELEMRLKKQEEKLVELLNKVSNLEFLLRALIQRESAVLAAEEINVEFDI